MSILGLLCFLAGAFAVAVILILVTERYRLGRVERYFFWGRSEVSDEEYLRSFLARAELREYLLAARRAMAELCGTTPEMIHADDSMRTLMAMQFDNGYIQDLADGIEKRSRHRIDSLRMSIPGNDTFAEYLIKLADLNNPGQAHTSPHG